MSRHGTEALLLRPKLRGSPCIQERTGIRLSTVRAGIFESLVDREADAEVSSETSRNNLFWLRKDYLLRSRDTFWWLAEISVNR